MKHLKVIARANLGKDTFNLTIKEQTHFYDKFGGGQKIKLKEPGYQIYAFVFGEVALLSSSGTRVETFSRHTDNFAAWGLPRGVNVALYVCGFSEKTTLPVVIKGISVEHWPSIKAAIAAYNEFYA